MRKTPSQIVSVDVAPGEREVPPNDYISRATIE
jgi:hypothetical protein